MLNGHGFTLSNRLWCLTCERLAVPECHEEAHKVANLVERVQELDFWLVGVKKEGNQGIEEVTKGLEPLQVEMERMETKLLKAIKVQMEELESYRKKLTELMAYCEEIKLLPSESKATDSVRRNVEKTMTDIKQEVIKALEFLKTISFTEDVSVEVCLIFQFYALNFSVYCLIFYWIFFLGSH